MEGVYVDLLSVRKNHNNAIVIEELYSSFRGLCSDRHSERYRQCRCQDEQ